MLNNPRLPTAPKAVPSVGGIKPISLSGPAASAAPDTIAEVTELPETVGAFAVSKKFAPTSVTAKTEPISIS